MRILFTGVGAFGLGLLIGDNGSLAGLGPLAGGLTGWAMVLAGALGWMACGKRRPGR